MTARVLSWIAGLKSLTFFFFFFSFCPDQHLSAVERKSNCALIWCTNPQPTITQAVDLNRFQRFSVTTLKMSSFRSDRKWVCIFNATPIQIIYSCNLIIILRTAALFNFQIGSFALYLKRHLCLFFFKNLLFSIFSL